VFIELSAKQITALAGFKRMSIMTLCFSIRTLRNVFVAGFIIFLTGCAATVAPPAVPSADLDWSVTKEIPATIRNSLQESSLKTVAAGEGAGIPIRVFGPEGSRTPVAMIHGLQSHSGWFSQSAAFIAALGHPVYVIDRRGSGLSQAARGDIKDFMDWATEIHTVAELAMAEHGNNQLFVLGHCFGAIPATVYAEEHAATVRGLILTTPGIYTHTSIPFSQTLKILFSSPGERNYYFPVPLDPNQFSELPEYEPFIAGDPLALRAVTGDLYWQIHRAREYIKSHVTSLQMPILVGMAGEDEIADNQENRKWLATVPADDKTLTVYPDARHILEYSTVREEYFKDLARWLARIEGY
jgi:alpha-beta hydrolase superfamily lysophospholipase